MGWIGETRKNKFGNDEKRLKIYRKIQKLTKKEKIEFISKSEKHFYSKFILHEIETQTTFLLEIHVHRIIFKLSNNY